MLTLAIDTSTKFFSLSIVNEKNCLYELNFYEKKTHARHLVGNIKCCVETLGISINDIELFVSSLGPGSFTGVRVALSTLKGISFALKKPIVGVSSLFALAMNLSPFYGIAIPIIDAKRNEIYSAVYKINDEEITEIYSPCVISPYKFIEKLSDIVKNEDLWILGDGVSIYSKLFVEKFKERVKIPPLPFHFIRAVNLAIEGQRIYRNKGSASLFPLSPLYLRASDAELKQ